MSQSLKRALAKGWKYSGKYHSSNTSDLGRVDLVKNVDGRFKFISFWRTVKYLKKIFPNKF